MKIPSWHRSLHTPLQRSSLRDLAKTIARDETNMSTIGIVLANYSQCAPVLSCFILHFYLFSYLYILDEKDKKRFITIFREKSQFYYLSKTPPLSRPQLIRVFISTTHTTPFGMVGYQHFHLSTSCTFLTKLSTWSSTASQLSISEDSAIRIVYTLCRGSTLFPHPSGNSSCQPRPAIQGACEVEPPAIAFPLLMLVQDPTATIFTIPSTPSTGSSVKEPRCKDSQFYPAA